MIDMNEHVDNYALCTFTQIGPNQGILLKQGCVIPVWLSDVKGLSNQCQASECVVERWRRYGADRTLILNPYEVLLLRKRVGLGEIDRILFKAIRIHVVAADLFVVTTQIAVLSLWVRRAVLSRVSCNISSVFSDLTGSVYMW